MNFGVRIQATAERFPDHIAIERVGTGTLHETTYRQLSDLSAGWAGRLAGEGVRRGDRVAILADNDERWIGVYVGILRLGAVAVPLDTAYGAAQLRTILRHCGATVLCLTPKYVE